ncbi:MAG: hypothetical protein PHV35_05565 [Mariniphaga sp.]|nr:hypothetical protein [Mariniphaga sp.]MDD4225115.1 hypothetical protein [Mariniphaga sp.]
MIFGRKPVIPHPAAAHLTLQQHTSPHILTRISHLLLELNKPDINIPADSTKTFEFLKTPELIELGREITQERIREFRE